MEEEVGIKVTRLRRRLSVEADDVKSPSKQSTPTKKRGGRLAAKPQLELIDENATETDKPKNTRKSTARDVETEEKPATPCRRSTRIKSNTSIVSETTTEADDKGTPSRRNTRSKSNTSLVAETVQFSDSPRAKRAARRTSQVGSDSETPVTPARQTRRTRKDSTSSIDKQVELPNKLATQVNDIIVEESENNVKDTSNNTPTKERSESPSVRKSPRLIEKTCRKTSSPDNGNKENVPEGLQKTEKPNKSDSMIDIEIASSSTNVDQNIKIMEENNLSVSSSNLIKDLESEPKKPKFDLSKTSSEADLLQAKSKRHRTKSWTTISSSPAKDRDFLSDTEAIKKKNKYLNLSVSECGDGLLNKSKNSAQENENHEILEVFNSPTISEKKKKNCNDKLIAENTEEKELINYNSSNVTPSDPTFTEKFFSVTPTGAVQSIVYIDDSDSNTETVDKVKVNKELETEDQCVPVVEHHLEDENCKESKNNLSYEPMDIDETLPENTSLILTEKSISVKQEDKDSGLEKRKSMLNISQVNNVSINNSAKEHWNTTVLDLEEDNEVTLNKSKRNSIISVTKNEETNKNINNLERKSGIANISVDHIEVNNDEFKSNGSKISNKSKRKSSITKTTIDDVDSNSENIENNDTNNSFTKSKRKSSVTSDIDVIIVKDSNTNKSKIKSSISNIEADDDLDKNSSLSDTVNDVLMNASLNKCKIKSSATDKKYISNFINNDEVVNNSKRKSSIENVDLEMNKSPNKNKRKSSITSTDNNKSLLKGSEKSERKSSISNNIDNDEVDSSSERNLEIVNGDVVMNETSNTMSDDNIDISSDRFKRKSVNTNDESVSMNKSSNKSKRKSSITNVNIDNNMDKSGNASKSTLVLSQLKDTSETNAHKDTDEFNELNDSKEQLSKSIVSKISDKKNISSTYSTSTPLHQKSMKKLGMQINTSIITPNNVSKIEIKESLNKSKKETSVLSQNDEESEEESEEDSNEEECSEEENEEDSEEENDLKNKSKMIDDEAEEASDDYESGDSRNEDEKEYEKQNEIVDKGETLDSEDEDFSDDSNYEKGSFIVDSDEEDHELLSGSGDDLSMSADELTMSAKSKKKFNERKIKEQKKASKEMYESRHKLNESEQSAKSDKRNSKKYIRQRLVSSESEANIDIQPKKHRRARIDSSQDLSMSQSDAEKPTSKKKNKRLSESACEENVTNEKEILVQENKGDDKIDPLSLQNIVKLEPKTPQKDLNISTVSITNIEKVEEVQIDETLSITKINQTSDPLECAVTLDDVMGDDSNASISENEEITQNYESMLKDLNKKPKKIKSLDISLNLNKKAKEITKEPIVDQLNLTEVKKLKTKNVETHEISDPKASDGDESKSSKTLKTLSQINILDESSSDSIEMKLLFDEDSTDIENKETAGQESAVKDVEYIIPLKRTEAKTNILDSTDVTHTAKEDSILNISKSKKAKRKSSQTEETVAKNDQENKELGFFIDTIGTQTDMNQSVTNTSMKENTKKNKQKNNVSFANIEDINNDDGSNDAPLEVSYQSDKKNKSKQDLNTTQIDINSTSMETPNQSGKKKKKNKKGLDSSQINTEGYPIDTDDKAEKCMNTCNLSMTDSNKKKKKLPESHAEQGTEKEIEAKSAQNISMGSIINKKTKTISESSVVENIIKDDANIGEEQKNTKKRKRKPSANPSLEEIKVKDGPKLLSTSKTLNESVITNEKKKRKILHIEEATSSIPYTSDVPEIKSQVTELFKSSGKKSKNKTVLIEKQEPEEINDEPTKKSKKRKERDDDDGNKLPKIIKQNSSDKVHVPRLPASVINQLDDKPKLDAERKENVVATTSFKVEETKKRRNKPSQYLEQSVYLNDSIEEKTKKSLLKKPKVLPFMPTASTSDHGFTTKFQINVISQDTRFVAQSTDMSNFKKDYLHNNRIKKLGTFEKYKRHRNVKISKF